MNQTNSTGAIAGEFNITNLEKLASIIYKKSHKDKQWKPSIFSGFMNSLGWYRTYKVIVFDNSVFKPLNYPLAFEFKRELTNEKLESN